MNILLKNEFLFITKQGIFIFLDKLSKVIEVKKDLTKFRFAKLFFIVIANGVRLKPAFGEQST